MLWVQAPVWWCLLNPSAGCLSHPFSKVQAVHGAAMTGVQEPDPREQRGEPPEEDGEEEEEEEKVRVSVEAEEEEEEKDELPYPSLAPVVLLALTQTSPPRSWCLRAVCHPYLWQAANACTFVFIIRERHCLFVFQLCTFSMVLYLRGTCHIVVYFRFKHKEDGKEGLHRVCVCFVDLRYFLGPISYRKRCLTFLPLIGGFHSDRL